MAANLIHNRTKIVGILVPDVDHPFFSSYVRHVEATLYEMGYKTMIGNTIGRSNREKEFLDLLDQNMVDGIITACHTLQEKEYLKHKRTIISLDRDFGSEIPMIGSDHETGGRIAAEIFLQNKCKRVLNISGEAPGIVATARHYVLNSILQEYGVEVVDLVMEWNRLGHEDYWKLAQKGYMSFPSIDGVFGTDQPALFYMRQAINNGRRVPEDVKVVVYDGMYIAKLSNPEATCICQDVKLLAELSANSVVDLIEERRPVPQKQIIPVTLHQGGSTYPVKISGITER